VFVSYSRRQASLSIPSLHRHPNPHKGVLVFNGPLGMPFDRRPSSCIHPNDAEFVKKRHFSIISLQTLIARVRDIQSRVLNREDFWESIHATAGEII
jgi:hypothetical protein